MPEKRLKTRSATDVSAVTSVAIDSPERLRNLGLWADYLATIIPDIELVVIEQDQESRINGKLDVGCAEVQHHLVPSPATHWKTRNLNLGAKLSTRPILLLLDCDVLLPEGALSASIQSVREEGGFVQPFNGVMAEFNEVPCSSGKNLAADLNKLPHFDRDYDQADSTAEFNQAAPIYGGSDYHATGGAMVCRRTEFFEIGGYNENFVSYGFEDMEFFERIARLERRLRSLPEYNAYHLPHPRGDDSTYSTHYRANQQEYQHVMEMSAENLMIYALNGFRELEFRHGYLPRISQDKDHYHVDLVEDIRLHLGDMDLVFVVLEEAVSSFSATLEALLDGLESHCTGYRVRLFEIGSRTLRHPGNKAKYVYQWLDSKRYREDNALEFAAKYSGLMANDIELVTVKYDPGHILGRLASRLEGQGLDPDCLIEQLRAKFRER